VSLTDDWGRVLLDEAAGYARVALANIGREFPTVVHHAMTGPGDLPVRPGELTPVFYGSYDWHSCVEMHWLLVRLLREVGDAVLSRALPYARSLARAGQPALADAITAKALAWYRADTGYPGDYEPSGNDFLSPALTEAELMAQLLLPADFAAWLAEFLPGIESGRPPALFTPAVVSDSSDGLIAHLHGLNASRAWCWRRLTESLPDGDPRVGPALQAARAHAEAALPHVIGDDYMVEHWLAAYAVLLLS
jgi:Protein of unknown function (DUF2891)